MLVTLLATVYLNLHSLQKLSNEKIGEWIQVLRSPESSSVSFSNSRSTAPTAFATRSSLLSMRITLVSLVQTIIPITCIVVSPYILQHIGIGEWSWPTVVLWILLPALVSLPRWLSILLEVLPYCQIVITIIAYGVTVVTTTAIVRASSTYRGWKRRRKWYTVKLLQECPRQREAFTSPKFMNSQGWRRITFHNLYLVIFPWLSTMKDCISIVDDVVQRKAWEWDEEEWEIG